MRGRFFAIENVPVASYAQGKQIAKLTLLDEKNTSKYKGVVFRYIYYYYPHTRIDINDLAPSSYGMTCFFV